MPENDTRPPENRDMALPESITFHYLKAQNFRTIHADGVIGNITPAGYIHMAVYSERPAIPQEMIQKVNPDGTLGEVIPEKTIVRDGIVREMDMDVLMSVAVAKNIKSWLEDKIKDIDNRNSLLQQSEANI